MTDHIAVSVSGSEKIQQIFEKHRDAICADVLADEVRADIPDGYRKDWNINGESVTLSVLRL